MTWKTTGYGYDLWEGKASPPCPNCGKPLTKVEVKTIRVLVWNKNTCKDDDDFGLGVFEEDDFTQDNTQPLVGEEAYCTKCKKALPTTVGIGVMGVNCFYRNTPKNT